MSRLTTSRDLIQSHLPVRSPIALPQPGLPDWVMKLPGIARVVNKLGVGEFRRRLFHMSPALLPFVLPLIPHDDVWGPGLMLAILIVGVVTLVTAQAVRPLVTRNREDNWTFAVLGYMAPVIAPILLLPGRAELGLMTLQILALGDGSATFGGLTIGGRRLPWNPKKTFVGLFCFTLVGSLAATYSFWHESRPGVSLGTAFVICGVAGLCAGLVESLPIRSNDNLRVGTTALLVGASMSAWLL